MDIDKAIRAAIREAKTCGSTQWVYACDNGTYEVTDNPAVYNDERIIGYVDVTQRMTWVNVSHSPV